MSNDKERLLPLNPCQRNLDTSGTGDVVRDGYVTRQRRPRTLYSSDMVDVDRAERIEGFMSEPFDGMDDD